jgi:hypothetical protein
MFWSGFHRGARNDDFAILPNALYYEQLASPGFLDFCGFELSKKGIERESIKEDEYAG